MPSLNRALLSTCCCNRRPENYTPLAGTPAGSPRSSVGAASSTCSDGAPLLLPTLRPPTCRSSSGSGRSKLAALMHSKDNTSSGKRSVWKLLRWRRFGGSKQRQQHHEDEGDKQLAAGPPVDRELDKSIRLILDKADKLLNKLDEHEPELAGSQDEECVICVGAKATMQTFPCGHRVVCRKCFVKTIQMAVSQRMLPLRCVICRTKIIRLKQTTSGFATPASHTAHLANTRACLLRQSNAVDADGFGRAPFITPDDYVKPLQPNKPQISKQECRFHRHWKNKVAAAPLPHDVTESLNENDLNKRIEMRPSLYKEDRKKKQAVKGIFPHLDTPGPAKIVKKASTSILTHVSLNPTIAVGSSFSSHKTSNLSIVPAPSGDEHVISDGATKNSRNQKKSKFEGVLKDHEDIHAIAENELDIIPLTQLGKPQSPVNSFATFIDMTTKLL